MIARTRRSTPYSRFSLAAGAAIAILACPDSGAAQGCSGPAPGPVIISGQPQSQTIASGATATMTVTAGPPGCLEYQWYEGTSGDQSRPIAGATAASYTTPPLTTTHQYWVLVAYAFHPELTQFSATATITIANAPPGITAQPQSQAIASGQTATMNVAASGTAPFTYQWYVGTSGTTSSPIGGATASSYTTPVLTTTTNYWVRVSNAFGTANSNTATITVGLPPNITTHPQSQTIASGSTATLSVAATGTATLTYQWYVGASGDTSSPMGGATANSYTTPPLTTATNYWVRVSNTFGTASSSTATIAIGVAPSITTQPPSQTICHGGVVTIGVAVSGTAPFTYQWYAGTSGDTSTPAGGGSTYTTPPLTTTTSYWVRVSNPYGTVDSSTAAFTIHALSLTPASATFGQAGGGGSAAVTTDAACSWSASTPASWISFGANTGLGAGTMTFTVQANTTGAARSAAITVRVGISPGADQTFLVTQLLALGDFDGDGKTDPAVYRPSTGGWHVLKSSANYGASQSFSWGLSTDLPVPGDYDGDGNTDPAVQRPSTGGWYVLKSSTGYSSSFGVSWGLSTDVSVPGDYDGDGKTDPAIYRPSTGLWAILQSSTNYGSAIYVSWGLSTDLPLPGDYDGDGKVDPAVYRPSTGGWHVLKSSASYTASFSASWGLSTDVAVPGDYDGDGKIDPAVFRPSTGGWHFLESSTTYTTSRSVFWGLSTDNPVPADYDGDGKSDPAIFRPSTGGWHVLKSSAAYSTSFGVSWGLSTDVPMNKRP